MNLVRVSAFLLAVMLVFSIAASQESSDICDRKQPLIYPPTDLTNPNQCGRTYDNGQCVWYARCRSGYHGPRIGSAKYWPSNQKDNSRVQTGDVVIFTSPKYGKDGHVAYVESVDTWPDGSVRVNTAQFNAGKRLNDYPNLSNWCGVTTEYGTVTHGHLHLHEFQGLYHPGGESAPSQPMIHISGASTVSLKAGEATELTGNNFVHGSRVVLLQQAPGAPELILTNLNADTKGSIQWHYQSTCDSKVGKYIIRALDQPVTPGAAPGTKSNSVTINIDGRSSNCSSLFGIKKAQASSDQTAGAGPILDNVTPTSHVAGQFAIDIYGSGFQQGAKIVAQGSDGSSDKAAAITYLGPNHLKAVIIASNSGQFFISVKNPDGQISTSQSFQVTSNATSTQGPAQPPPRSGGTSSSNSSGSSAPPNSGSPGTGITTATSETAGSTVTTSGPSAGSRQTNPAPGPISNTPGASGVQSPLPSSPAHPAAGNSATLGGTSATGSPATQNTNGPSQKPPVLIVPSPNSGSISSVPRIAVTPAKINPTGQVVSPSKNMPSMQVGASSHAQPATTITSTAKNQEKAGPAVTHNQPTSGPAVSTGNSTQSAQMRHDAPKAQPPQINAATPAVHNQPSVPTTNNKTNTSQNTQLPRGPAPIKNTAPPPPPAKTVPPPPQPNSAAGNQKSSSPSNKTPVKTTNESHETAKKSQDNL